MQGTITVGCLIVADHSVSNEDKTRSRATWPNLRKFSAYEIAWINTNADFTQITFPPSSAEAQGRTYHQNIYSRTPRRRKSCALPLQHSFPARSQPLCYEW